MSGKKVKTSININEQVWTDFSVVVIKKHGGRKKNDVIEQLLIDYIRENEEANK
ncbi:MAG: hypothetical protein NWF07_09585 [Candidatus Bathyarchaeota archaeon]|nr:hypothetical protein [Candidatus Bathyarchaeota archaeon]